MSVTVAMYLGSGSGVELPIPRLINQTRVLTRAALCSVWLLEYLVSRFIVFVPRVNLGTVERSEMLLVKTSW